MSRRKRRKAQSEAGADSGSPGERLQKVLASAGIGSRRECEELIVAGRIEVDGRVVKELGSRVDPQVQEVRVDGVAIPRPRRVYFALHKPAGIVCTNSDPSGRVRAVDLVRSDDRLFTVGRLDRGSEGLILLTNDGELANRLTHPRYGVEKRYIARVVGNPDNELFARLRRGIHLAEGVARVSDIQVKKRAPRFVDLEISLREGRNREIRRILARVGHKVVRLKRIAIGPLRLGMLPVGASRPLTRDEIHRLQKCSDPRQAARRDQATASNPGAASPGPARQGAAKRGASKQSATQQRPAKPAIKPAAHAPAPSKPRRPPARAPIAPAAPAEGWSEQDEVEVREWSDSAKKGSVLSFDDSDSPTSPPPRRKRRS